ncbi:MAG: ABC transporter permease subunit [Chloroflexi bacterium]|nr:ABC transporter permease subunit [Chloroflexota bacterium]
MNLWLVIARKDLLQAVRNRYLIGVLIISLLISAGLRVIDFDTGTLASNELPPVDFQALKFSIAVFSPFAIVCAFVVPLMMVEEKERQTLRFLQISPATIVDVLAGKALVGIVFCLAMSGMGLIFSGEASSGLSAASLAMVALGSILFTGVGLLSSAFFQTSLQANTWAGIPVMVLFFGLIGEVLPLGSGLANLVKLIPAHSASVLLRASLNGSATVEDFAIHVIYFGAWIAAIYALTIWLYQRSDHD